MLAENTTYFPSGVNAEGISEAEFVVSLRAEPPLAGITNTSVLPKRSLAKAICLPSGDHTGDDSYESCVVSCTASPPLADTL